MGKIFRVFFSSTFSDFVEERNALQKKVFPQLKELCAANGTRFQPIDLRWGIPNEIALQQSTMQICLEEIKRCQNLTPRPNFLVLLGERYGWTPPPAKIPKTEYDVISAHFSEEEKILIKEWYSHDENELCKLDDGTITTVYELQPRGENYEDYKKWEPIEIELRYTLLEATRKAKLSEKEMVKYYGSATHQEIVMGALETYEAETHVHSFFRKLNGLPDGAKLDVYLESEIEKIKFLSNLKEELRHKLPLNIHEYEVNLGDEKDKERHLEKFCNDVYNSLETTILQELEDMEEISALDEEMNAHIEFGKTRTKVFVGRQDILNDIVDYVENENRAPFMIYGEPGSGKSALMAKALEKLEKSNIDADYIMRFIGTTPSSSDSIALIRNICEQIINKYEIEFEEEIPFKYNELKKTFSNILGLIEGGRRAVILLDALDQLPRRDKGRDLTWLPQELPENVKLITSFATDDSDIMNTLKKKLPSSLHELKRLSPEEGVRALNILLENALRRLTPEQKEEILQNFSENGLPLYLKLAFEESCTWNSYDALDSTKLVPYVEGLIEILFKRLYKEHTQMTIERILCYIVAARNGLTEDEILDVLTSDPDYFRWYKEEQIHHDLPEERLPWIVWSRLHFDLEPYLTTRGVDKTSTFVFFHRQFNEAVKRNFLSKIAEDRHQILANYFNNANLYYQINGKKTPNYRKLSELVYNLRKAKIWESLKNILTSLEFIEAKCTAVMTDDLLIDYNQSLDDLISNDIFEGYRKNIIEFKQFVTKQAHILRKYPHLTVQQAVNQPDSTLPSQVGKDFIKITDFSRPWIEWLNKPQERDLCILTFAGHSDDVHGCAFSPDGTKVVSASSDDTLKLWEAETGAEIRTFQGHKSSVDACAFSPDGKKIISASYDTTLKLWDAETGVEIKTFKGHSNWVQTCAFSPDGTKILSASDDNTLKLWEVQTGEEIRTFAGHSDDIHGCAFSPDGKKILSASYDKTLKLWDINTGIEIRSLDGHSEEVNACVFSPDGTKILSASYDKTLKLWNINTGTEVRTFQGHFWGVLGCAFSPDGLKILSASDDETLKLWDIETGAEIGIFLGHSRSINGCAFSQDGTKILSASDDKTLKLWDIEKNSEIEIPKGHSDWVEACTFSPDGKRILSASRDKTLKLWDVETRIKIRTFSGHSDDVHGCAFSPDGMRMVSASYDKTLKLWDIETGAEIRSLKGHSEAVSGCAFSPDGVKVLSASRDTTLKLWNAETGTEIRSFKGHSDGVQACTFSPDGTKILSASWDNTLKLWGIETGNEINSFTGHSRVVLGCAFSLDGTKILSASYDKTLKLWDIETCAEIRSFAGHSEAVSGCAFSLDDKKILSASWDNTLRLWDAETGNELIIFHCLGEATTITIRANGLIAAGDGNGRVYILRLHGIDLASNPQK